MSTQLNIDGPNSVRNNPEFRTTLPSDQTLFIVPDVRWKLPRGANLNCNISMHTCPIEVYELPKW